MAEKKTTATAEDEAVKTKAKKTQTVAKKKTTDDGREVIEVTETNRSATGYRVGAIILWVFAIVFEILGILALTCNFTISFMNPLTLIIILLILDLVCVIIGSQLWKRSNRIDPASKKNKIKFWLWNNLGLIVAIVAFLPFIIMIAKDNKKLDKKTKIIALVAAIVALLIGGLCSIDYNPISSEEKDKAEAKIEGNVYWAISSRVYHTDKECGHLKNSDPIFEGTVKEAIEGYPSRERLCATCAKKYAETHEGFTTTGIVTDDSED